MGEEVRMTEYEVNDKGDYNGDDERIPEWEMGLPNGTDLTPLSQSLIPPELASAFSILPIPCRTHLDVNRASQTTLSSIRGSHAHSLSSTDNNNSNNLKTLTENRDPMVTETEEQDQNGSFVDSRSKSRRPDCTEEADSALRTDNSNEDPSARTLKRPRLVWTPQLHKRFVDVVAHLGIKNAVPKTIMQLMNVEGLTRENVASHLQKYRLYLKRMQGLSNDDPSSSDHQLFASTPVPPHNNGSGNSGHVGMAAYGAPAGMMTAPMYGMINHQGFHHGHGFDPSMYNMNMNMGMGMNMNMGMNNMMHQQRDWSVNKHGYGHGHGQGSVVSYPQHVAPSSDK
ncbi:hypothetical protein CISIN_1g047187mg [Citrus sinensis]|uniref:HTH myb-type domain-containing protein n=1 Tax=Citrus sinensis TaxID=2711 RepID=A0A067FZK3_CITSI|nr:hypothetical protein CISIN_1g047187mg [Citrus sinensis]